MDATQPRVMTQQLITSPPVCDDVVENWFTRMPTGGGTVYQSRANAGSEDGDE